MAEIVKEDRRMRKFLGVFIWTGKMLLTVLWFMVGSPRGGQKYTGDIAAESLSGVRDRDRGRGRRSSPWN
jgi:hypothetical protein